MRKLSKSRELLQQSNKFTMGGIHSNIRYPPLYFVKADGSKLWDVDGTEYIDCVTNFGACILGHRHPKVVQKVREQLETGLTVGVETELNVVTAQMLSEMVPSADVVRFCNSGTEAIARSIMISRGYTGRDRIVKVEGCYDGWYDDVLVSWHPDTTVAGPPSSPIPIPESSGLRKNVLSSTLVIPFNDTEAAEKVLKQYQNEIAALIMEPVMFNIGCALPQDGYLQSIREITEKLDIPLIFDEVITGFRLAPGGAQEYYGVTPDITTFAKAMANGFPLAAVVGKEDIMKVIDPTSHKVVYGGTYNANQLAVAAALASLEILRRGDIQKYLHESIHKMIRRFQEFVEDNGILARMQGLAGKFQVYFTDTDVIDYRTAYICNEEIYMKFHNKMIEQNIYCLPKYLLHHGITSAHNKNDIEAICTAIEKALISIKG